MSDFPAQAKKLVFDYVSTVLDPTDTHVSFKEDDVYVVNFGYVLGHWKAMVSTTLPDGMYYEVTHRNETGETYVDGYKRVSHVVVDEKQKVRIS